MTSRFRAVGKSADANVLPTVDFFARATTDKDLIVVFARGPLPLS
jgi:hypothetical protein